MKAVVWGEEHAKKILATRGIAPTDSHYKLVYDRLMAYFADVNALNSWVWAMGAQLEQITSGDTISADGIAMIREFSRMMRGYHAIPNIDALVLTAYAAELRIRRTPKASARKKAASKRREAGAATQGKIRKAFNERKIRRQSTSKEDIAADLGMNPRYVGTVMKKLKLS